MSHVTFEYGKILAGNVKSFVFNLDSLGVLKHCRINLKAKQKRYVKIAIYSLDEK
jgi:hypothetical protein